MNLGCFVSFPEHKHSCRMSRLGLRLRLSIWISIPCRARAEHCITLSHNVTNLLPRVPTIVGRRPTGPKGVPALWNEGCHRWGPVRRLVRLTDPLTLESFRAIHRSESRSRVPRYTRDGVQSDGIRNHTGPWRNHCYITSCMIRFTLSEIHSRS